MGLFICLLVVTQQSAAAAMSTEPPWLQIIGRKERKKNTEQIVTENNMQGDVLEMQGL